MASRSKKVGLFAGATAATIAIVGLYDITQKKKAVLRSHPIIGHARYLLQAIRPEIQQYFIERDWDGRPFSRTTRELIYDRSNNAKSEEAFGSLRDVEKEGAEWLVHSVTPLEPPATPPRVTIGGPDCSKPYDMALMNVSAMSFGALSANAIHALNAGAHKGGFAHDSGEGGISPYHHAGGGDLVWEIGSGYFGARTEDGQFSPEKFAEKASHDQVKCVSLKLSQGAKPGIGGVLPGDKVTAEIAETRGVPQGQKCISPAQHKVFSTPVELIEFIAKMRELAGGKPAGFKLCVTSQRDVLALCKAMIEVGTTPDFIIVDGSEGGTGAAPEEFEDNVGMPLTQGLLTMHNALVGAGLRDKIKIGVSGKIATGADIVKRLIQGADYTNAARPMMMALGCIQSLRCATNTCPTGIATQSPIRQRALHVPTKIDRVHNYQKNTVDEALRLMASMGVHDTKELTPHMLRRNLSGERNSSYAELYRWLEPGELLSEAPQEWAMDWKLADAHRFGFAASTR